MQLGFAYIEEIKWNTISRTKKITSIQTMQFIWSFDIKNQSEHLWLNSIHHKEQRSSL